MKPSKRINRTNIERGVTCITVALVCLLCVQIVNVFAAPQHNSPYGACVVLTFDDWVDNHVEYVLPIMQEFGFTGIGFYPTDRVFDSKLSYVDALTAAGWEIGSHSVNHNDITAMTYSQRDYQLTHSKAQWESLTAIDEVIVYTAPFLSGQYGPDIRTHILSRYGYVRPATASYIFKNSMGYWDPLGMLVCTDEEGKAVDKARYAVAYATSNQCPVWFLIHRVYPTITEKRTLTPATFRQVLQVVEDSGLPVVTMRELVGMLPYNELPPLIAEWTAPTEDVAVLRDASGSGHDLTLHGVTLLHRQEDLVDHPHLFFDGDGSYAEVDASPNLNPQHVTISLWFRAEDTAIESQVPLLVKSLPQHAAPWYQYGLFLMDTVDHPEAVIFYVSVQGRTVIAEAQSTNLGTNWNHVAATYDGAVARVFLNGREVAQTSTGPAPLDAYDTPLLLGAYANVPKNRDNCFNGAIASVRLYGGTLDAEAVLAEYERTKDAYPDRRETIVEKSEYAKQVSEVLREDKDVWGEALIAQGGATYDSIKDYLRPLFYSTGYTNETLDVHNLLFGLDGGEPPYIIPVADGSRIAANRYDDSNDLTIFVGDAGTEQYGSELERLAQPVLEGGYYPILRTAYEDATGNRYTQESFAAPLDDVDGLAAFVRITVRRAEAGSELSMQFMRGSAESGLASSQPLADEGRASRWTVNGDSDVCTVIWHPNQALDIGEDQVASLYDRKKVEWKAYWDSLLGQGAQFEVPEKLVMDVQRNLLIQNLIMRWRYSLGAVVYHNAFYQPESSGAVATLGLYGYPEAYRDGLEYLVDQTKGEAYYANWERGEKLTHAAHYFHLTRDTEFLERLTPKYEAFCEEFRRQIEADPNGLLQKERQCGDIPQISYFVWHQLLGWRGMRDLAVIWKEAGREDLYDRYFPVARGLKEAIARAMETSQVEMPDGTLFIPRMLLEDAPVEAPVTETRLGSYWNLCMPFAFASGFLDPQSDDMDRIVGFMRNHGSFLLGLLRFNYYPTPIGSYRANGLPGYYTTGFDNVYLPDYLQLAADRDEADHLILSFYGKLAHGQTRGTFVCGEGETVGERPGEFYRSCYGTPCSANNNAFLLPLRLMLVRESFNRETGMPENLYLAHATPREWLEDGKTIQVTNAPTCFGPVSYTVESHLAHNRIDASISLPGRNPTASTYLKLRPPVGHKIASVRVNGEPYSQFDSAGEVIDLSGLNGRVELSITYVAQ